MSILMNYLNKVLYLAGDIQNDAELGENFLTEPLLQDMVYQQYRQ